MSFSFFPGTARLASLGILAHDTWTMYEYVARTSAKYKHCVIVWYWYCFECKKKLPSLLPYDGSFCLPSFWGWLTSEIPTFRRQIPIPHWSTSFPAAMFTSGRARSKTGHPEWYPKGNIFRELCQRWNIKFPKFWTCSGHVFHCCFIVFLDPPSVHLRSGDLTRTSRCYHTAKLIGEPSLPFSIFGPAVCSHKELSKTRQVHNREVQTAIFGPSILSTWSLIVIGSACQRGRWFARLMGSIPLEGYPKKMMKFGGQSSQSDEIVSASRWEPMIPIGSLAFSLQKLSMQAKFLSFGSLL